MQPIQIISQDLFDKIRSRFSNLEMGDTTGAVTIDPAEALFFDFDFVIEGNNLGRVSMSLGDAGSLKVYYSQGITENQDDPVKKEWYRFLKEMRFFAMRRLLRFDTRDIAKTNLDKKDFQHLATTQGSKEDDMTTMNESRWNHKSSRKTSRAVQGKTEVIVRHTKPVDEEYAGSRSQRKNIKAIFIQNADGERFKYPFIHTAGAFAMAQHVDHGGAPHDPAGKAIIGMSEEMAQLAEFKNKVRSASLHDDAHHITERAIGRLNELRAQIEALGKKNHYRAWAETFDESAALMDTLAMDDVAMEEYKQKFTQTSFQEELAGYFPLLHRIMSETNRVDLEDFVGESEEQDEDALEAFDIGMGQASHGREPGPDDQFEAWAESVEQGTLTDDQVDIMRQELGNLPQGQDGLPELELGPEGTTAWAFFSELGIEDTDLQDMLKNMADIDPETNAVDVFQKWGQKNYPELVVALGMSADEEPEQEPEQEPDDGGDQPVAEGRPVEVNSKEVDVDSLKVDGIDLKDHPDYSDAYISYGKFADGTEMSDDELDNIRDNYGELMHKLVWDTVTGMYENDEAGGAPNTMMPKESMIQEIAKLVKSRYNRDNPDVGPFNGKENIALDIKKEIAEKFGDSAGGHAETLALEFMEKLSQQWQEKHGHVEDDGLARLKELINNIKGKVEGIGDRGESGKDFNTNIMSAEEQEKTPPVPVRVPGQRGELPDVMKKGEVVKSLDKKKSFFGKTFEEMDDILRLSGLGK
jgi:hypothetical protein